VFCRHQDLSMTADRALEREANIFAAELLMPPEAVASLYGGDPQSLGERLGVSAPALGWRLYNLGLVTERPAEERAAPATALHDASPRRPERPVAVRCDGIPRLRAPHEPGAPGRLRGARETDRDERRSRAHQTQGRRARGGLSRNAPRARQVDRRDRLRPRLGGGAG